MLPNKTNIPNCFIIGAPKCGTSAMAAYLNEHPSVFFCNPKEPFYWCDDYPQLRNRHNLNSLQGYLELFAEATDEHQVLAEGSTNYLASTTAVEEIMKFNPESRFIVMLRDPVEVVHAFHSEVLFSRIESEANFEHAWRLQTVRQSGRAIPAACEAPQFLQYAAVAHFPRQLKRFFSRVPESQRHVVLFDDFVADTSKVYLECIEFLGLEPYQKDSFDVVNSSHQHRFEWLSNLVLRPPTPLRPFVNSFRKMARKFKGGMVERLKTLLRKPTRRAPLRPGFRHELERFFAPQIQETSKLLGRDLGMWLGDFSPRKPLSVTKLMPEEGEE